LYGFIFDLSEFSIVLLLFTLFLQYDIELWFFPSFGTKNAFCRRRQKALLFVFA